MGKTKGLSKDLHGKLAQNPCCSSSNLIKNYIKVFVIPNIKKTKNKMDVDLSGEICIFKLDKSGKFKLWNVLHL